MARIPRSPSARFAGAAVHPEFFVVPTGTEIRRIYDPTSFGTTATTFRYNGPRQRFDHHPGIGTTSKRSPADSADCGVWYGALTLDCCVAEVFGGKGHISQGDRELAVVTTLRDLILIDLVEHAMKAGTIAAIAQTEHHYKAQDWSRAIYHHPDLPHVDGIYYRAAHTNGLAIALYERAEAALHHDKANTMRLDDPFLRPLLLAAADRCRLPLKP